MLHAGDLYSHRGAYGLSIQISIRFTVYRSKVWLSKMWNLKFNGMRSWLHKRILNNIKTRFIMNKTDVGTPKKPRPPRFRWRLLILPVWRKAITWTSTSDGLLLLKWTLRNKHPLNNSNQTIWTNQENGFRLPKAAKYCVYATVCKALVTLHRDPTAFARRFEISQSALGSHENTIKYGE